MKLLILLFLIVSLSSANECWQTHVPGSYPTGSQVSRLNHNYQANWTTQETPGVENWGGWEDMGVCNADTIIPDNQCWDSYEEMQYSTGSQVSYLGYNYKANWTTSETPGVQNWGGWEEVEACENDPIMMDNIHLSNTSVEEGVEENTVIGYLSVDEGITGKVVFRLVNGSEPNDNSYFSIHGDILRVRNSLKYSDASTRVITVEAMASDGSMIIRNISITITPMDVSDKLPDLILAPVSYSEFVLYAHDDIEVGSNVEVRGKVGSNKGLNFSNTVSAGWKSHIIGDIWVNSHVRMNCEVTLDGDVYAPGDFIKCMSVQHNGTYFDNVNVPYFRFPYVEMSPYGNHLNVGCGAVLDLPPGHYGDLSMRDESKLILHSGAYYFNKITQLSDSIDIIIDIERGETVDIYVNEDIVLGSGTQMIFKNKFLPASVKIYTNQRTPLIIPYAAKINAIISARSTTVSVKSDAVINGAIYANKIELLHGCKIIRPPYLSGIWHSEWAFGPSFDPSQLKYVGVLPLSTSNIGIECLVQDSNYIVSINDELDVSNIDITNQDTDVFLTVKDKVTGVSSDYVLNLKTQSNSVIYVDATPTGTGNDGTSWENAFKSLDDAIMAVSWGYWTNPDAMGKEIWLAEGVYKPTRRTMDYADMYHPPLPANFADRRANFSLYQGVEIIGGFDGTESERLPMGSPYNTILSGYIGDDVSQNVVNQIQSDSIDLRSLSENAFHVVNVVGTNGSKSARLKNVTITGGCANGGGDKNYGGGVFSKFAFPSIENCIIDKNASLSHGAGIYAGGGLESFYQSLFRDNYSGHGYGAGLFINKSDNVSLSSVVFDNNKAVGDNSIGGAVFANNSNIDFMNCVFFNNYAKKTGGVMYALNSSIDLIHNTVVSNTSTTGTGGISLVKSSADIQNSILWENNGEVEGDSIKIDYSCITGGYVGEGNISTPPGFVGDGGGVDRDWGTFDDGLRLKENSPCRDNGKNFAINENDLLQVPRPFGTNVDMGAYEYEEYTKQEDVLGKIINGEFVTDMNLPLMSDIFSEKQIYLYAKSNWARVFRLSIPSNKATRRKDRISIYLVPGTTNGANVRGANEVEVLLDLVSDNGKERVYQSATANNGKTIVFTSDLIYHGYPNKWAYVFFLEENGTINYRFPESQFRK